MSIPKNNSLDYEINRKIYNIQNSVELLQLDATNIQKIAVKKITSPLSLGILFTTSFILGRIATNNKIKDRRSTRFTFSSLYWPTLTYLTKLLISHFESNKTSTQNHSPSESIS